VENVPCPHCSEPIRPTATFCLACDRAVVDTERGLSVAETVPGPVGRPVLGLGIALACLVVLGGAAYGGVRIYRNAHAQAAAQARSDVRHGLELVVSAESGQSSACRALGPMVAEPASTTLSKCQTIVGDDKGARLGEVNVSTPHLGNGTGTVHVRATVTDRSGTHAVDETVQLVEVRKHWRMSWDGRPTASSGRT
jgi:hypothetical protein